MHPRGMAPSLVVDDVIDAMGAGRYHNMLLLLVGLAFGAEALEIMFLIFVSGQLQSDLGASEMDLSLLNTMVFGGMLVGALLWGVLADSYGRRSCVLFVLGTQLAGGFLAMLAPTTGLLIAARFVVGVGIGGLHIAPSLMIEWLPAKGREMRQVLPTASWSVCVLLLCPLAYALRHDSWRILAAVAIAPYVVCAYLAYRSIESPKFYLTHGMPAHAVAAVQAVAARNNYTDLPLDFTLVCADADVSIDENTTKAAEPLVTVPRPTWAFISEALERLRALFAEPGIRRLTLLLFAIWAAGASCYYGIVMLTTDTMLAGSDDSSALMRYGSVAAMSAAELPAYAVQYWAAKTYGRRTPLIVAPIVAAVFLVAFLLAYDAETGPEASFRFALALIAAFVARGAILIQFQMVYIMSPEAFPTAIRTAGTGACSAVARAASMIAPFVAFPLHDASSAAPYILFACLLLLAALAAKSLPFDTKDRVLEDQAPVSLRPLQRPSN
jgi:MFS family permease